MVSIGERLREERQKLKMSQTAFAERGGVTKKTQMLYEGNERFPDAQYLASVAEAGVDVLYVLTGRRTAAAAPEPAAPPTAPPLATVTTLPAPADGTLTWRQVLIAVVDEMTAQKLRMPGATLAELVDLLMLLQQAGKPLRPELVRDQLKLIKRA